MAVGLSLRFSVPAIERELEYVVCQRSRFARGCGPLTKRRCLLAGGHRGRRALVREDPAAVIHVPHALQFLLTEENLSRNIEELKVHGTKRVDLLLCLPAATLMQRRVPERLARAVPSTSSTGRRCPP